MGSFEGYVAEGEGLRLDRYVAEELGLLSRSQIKARKLKALLNGREAKLSRPVKRGDSLFLSWEEAESLSLIPEDLPLKIIYEDNNVVVIDQEQGMAVHPGAGLRSGTLANALLFRMGLEKTASLRPGIVHRLDKDTSGVLIAAYNDAALAFLAAQFKERTVKKSYLALVRGRPPSEQGGIETFLIRDPANRKTFTVSESRGKRALTAYRLLRSWDDYALLLLRPRTGRTHQLRVHLKHLGCPILGDPLYGKSDKRFPQASLMLHAKRLVIRLPPDGTLMDFAAPLPPRFRALIRRLDGQA
jgi:23S rRNA pseudouridine1911/1915/1917 synthase